MIGKQTTKLIIVCDDKTKEYANYLRQLVSVNDDVDEQIIGTKDGSVETAVWLEQQYLDTQATISSNDHVLFVGNNKASQGETKNMKIEFEKYGMKFGWLGKRGMMQVDDNLLNKEDYDSFIEFCTTYKQYFEKLAYQISEDEKETKEIEDKLTINKQEKVEIIEEKTNSKFLKAVSKATAVVADKVLEPIADVVKAGAKGAYEGVQALAVHKKIKDQQYRALTVILYLDGLQRFLEG